MGGFSDIFPLLAVLGLFLLILYLSYLFSKHVALGAARSSQGGCIKVLDRVALGQDKLLAVIQVGERVLLVGLSGGAVQLLAELSPEDIPPTEEGGQSFSDVFSQLLPKRKKE